MNPLAIGLIGIGIVFLLSGISAFTKNKRAKGLVFTFLGLLAIVTPFVTSYLIAK